MDRMDKQLAELAFWLRQVTEKEQITFMNSAIATVAWCVKLKEDNKLCRNGSQTSN